ncbi:MAG: hypothetical protein ACM31C_32475 [Acidobacteriota bacterium]
MTRAVPILVLAALLVPAAASAGPRDDCATIVVVPDSDDLFAWNQVMTLAACLQDDRVPAVRRADEVHPVVEELTRALAPTMLIYLEALEHGPQSIQLRAAYQIGAANLALIVRARTALAGAAPAVRDELEPLLAHAFETAWIAFVAVDHAADDDPAFAPDDVTRTMVRSARAFLNANSLPETDTREPRMARDARPSPPPTR